MSADVVEQVETCKEKDTVIKIGGVELQCHIEADVTVTYEKWHDYTGSGSMEEAELGSEEGSLDSVEMEVTIANKADTQFVTFKSTDTNFFEEHFGDIEPSDLIGLV